MKESIPFIDAHVHADSRSGEEFVRLQAAGCVGLVAVAGPGGGFSSPESLLDHFRRLDLVDRARIERAGLRAWVALGAHPGGIPESRVDDFLDCWPDALREYGAAAVGEIGLERCTEEEERVLARGLEVAAEVGLPVVMHTPREGKGPAVERSLEMLGKSRLDAGRVLLDHLDLEVVPRVMDSGCWLGLSVHPAKLGPGEAAGIVAERGAGRFVIDSDMGANPSYLFAVPAVISAMEDMGLDEHTIRAVVHDHAARLLGPDS